jgi:hypothetical protein
MKRMQRNHSAACKAKAALAALKGDKTLAELSPQFSVRSAEASANMPGRYFRPSREAGQPAFGDHRR